MTEHGTSVVYSPDQADSLWSYANPWRLLTDLARRRQLIVQFVLREVQGRYRGSYLGIVWAMVNPLLVLAVYTFIFSVVAQLTWPGGSGGFLDYALHMFSGLIAWSVFAESTTRAPGLIIGNPNYVKKVVFPLEILPVSMAGSALVHSLCSLVVLLIASAAMGQWHWTLVLLPLPYIPLLLLSLGLGWLLSSLGVFIRDIGHVIGVGVQLLFFLTPITYPLERLGPRGQAAMWLNPMTAIVENFRRVINDGQAPDWPTLGIATLVAAVVAVVGYAWFMKMKRALADVI